MNEAVPGYATTRLKPHQCPACGHEHNAATGAEPGNNVPDPGSVSICIRCGAISLFNDEMQLRAPTAEELADIKRSQTWPIIERIQKSIHARNQAFGDLPELGKRIAGEVEKQWGWIRSPEPPIVFQRRFVFKTKRRRKGK